MPLYKFIHSLLNALVQIANKMRLQKSKFRMVGGGGFTRMHPPSKCWLKQKQKTLCTTICVRFRARLTVLAKYLSERKMFRIASIVSEPEIRHRNRGWKGCSRGLGSTPAQKEGEGKGVGFFPYDIAWRRISPPSTISFNEGKSHHFPS
jgi:hypothetical protein